MIFECSLNEILFSKVFLSKLFHLSSYYMLFCFKLLIINTTHSTITVKQRTGQYLPYLIHIDRTVAATFPAHFLKACSFKGFAHIL